MAETITELWLASTDSPASKTGDVRRQRAATAIESMHQAWDWRLEIEDEGGGRTNVGPLAKVRHEVWIIG